MSFTRNNDINIIQSANLGVVNAGQGDDIYIISNVLADGDEITISDAQGADKIQLVGGLAIESFVVAANSVQLTLMSGAVITILNASVFMFEVGANATSGAQGVAKDFATFVSENLGVTLPTDNSIAQGGASTINEDGTSDDGDGTGTGGGTGTGTDGGTGGGTDGGTGASFDLTTAVDDISGSGGDDTFNGTRGDGAGPYTFNDGDILDGLGGTDTLNITTGAEASTPSDTLWASISNFEEVIFKSLGNGAQNITTGANFQAAFGAQGADVTVQTLLGAINLTMTSFTGTSDITTVTEGAGAHTIVTGSGVSTVNATGQSAGAQTINGVGLTTVTATINDAGDQVIGTTQGGNLVSVNATILAAGNQTIASTSDSNVTVVASAAAGTQTVTTAGGNDSITTTSAAGNTGTINSGAGNDMIVAGLTTDTITGGTGSDTMTGGGGVDTFAFGANGSVIGTDRDIISDFNKAGADILSFGGSAIVLTADSSALVAGANVQTSSGGLITFAAADNTLAKKIIAIQADVELDVAGSVGMFVDSGNTYVYYAGAAAGNADDQLIQLTGIDTLMTMTGGATLTIG